LAGINPLGPPFKRGEKSHYLSGNATRYAATKRQKSDPNDRTNGPRDHPWRPVVTGAMVSIDMHTPRLMLVVWCSAIPTASVIAQPAATTQPAPASCADRAADSAQAELVLRVLNLPFDNSRTIADWIANRLVFDLALRRALYEARSVQLDDVAATKTCYAIVSIELDELARRWARELYDAGQADTAALEPLRDWHQRIGVPRIAAVGRAAAQQVSSAQTPPGWRHLPPDALVLSRQTARYDAIARTLEWVRSLRLSSTQTLGRVFDLYPALEDAFRSELNKALQGKVTYEPYGVCRYGVQIDRATLLQWLADAASNASEQAPLPQLDFTQLTDPQWRGTVTLEGVAIAPPTWLIWPNDPAARPLPSWVAQQLTAIGRSDLIAGQAPSSREAAVEQARINAVENMWSQIDELLLPDQTRLGDELASPALCDPLERLEQQMLHAGQVTFDDDQRAVVKIVMPLAALWDLLNEAGAATMNASPSASQPASTTAKE
jgi:hypothetical protein